MFRADIEGAVFDVKNVIHSNSSHTYYEKLSDDNYRLVLIHDQNYDIQYYGYLVKKAIIRKLCYEKMKILEDKSHESIKESKNLKETLNKQRKIASFLLNLEKADVFEKCGELKDYCPYGSYIVKKGEEYREECIELSDIKDADIVQKVTEKSAKFKKYIKKREELKTKVKELLDKMVEEEDYEKKTIGDIVKDSTIDKESDVYIVFLFIWEFFLTSSKSAKDIEAIIKYYRNSKLSLRRGDIKNYTLKHIKDTLNI